MNSNDDPEADLSAMETDDALTYTVGNSKDFSDEEEHNEHTAAAISEAESCPAASPLSGADPTGNPKPDQINADRGKKTEIGNDRTWYNNW